MRAADFVTSYIDAWNHHDPRYVADHFTTDGIYYDVPIQEQHPKQELIRYLAEFFSYDQNHYELDGEIATGPHSIAFQYKVIAEDRSRGECWFGAEFVTLKGEQAVQIADYYKEPIASSDSGRKYAKSGLTDELLGKYKRALSSLMEQRKAYMSPSLTLPRLSHLVHCPINHLSQVINAGFGMSFFDYLNSYRIEEAKRLLKGADDPPRSILNVAFDVGFNSNSAFYSAFKRSCGQTPAQYRRMHAALGYEENGSK